MHRLYYHYIKHKFVDINTGQTSAPGVVTPTPSVGGTVRNCDFENRNLCGYSQDKTDTRGFDWRRQTGSTSSTNTGPRSDHTYGTSRGKFHLSWGNLINKLIKQIKFSLNFLHYPIQFKLEIIMT